MLIDRIEREEHLFVFSTVFLLVLLVLTLMSLIYIESFIVDFRYTIKETVVRI